MKVLDQRFGSCADMRKLFSPVSPGMAIVQLSKGPLNGRLQSHSLGAFRATLLETNQALFLAGKRTPGLCTMAFVMNAARPATGICAQGNAMPWPGLMGYNLGLNDFDLRLPRGSRVATLIIRKDHLLERLQSDSNRGLGLQRLNNTNLLELNDTNNSTLFKQLEALFSSNNTKRQPDDGDQIFETIRSALEDETSSALPVKKRENRHTAAIELLHWCIKHPDLRAKTDHLGQLLFQSRTSLFKGCQEHFGQTPKELQRSIRLDLVRQLLLDPEQCRSLCLNGVGAIAAHLGFSSRSHFAKRYEQQYQELPTETIKRE